jgi:hypothetical protein
MSVRLFLTCSHYLKLRTETDSAFFTHPCNLAFFGSSTLQTDTFEINRERAIDYLNTRDLAYVFDGFAGVCVPLNWKCSC